MHPSTSVRVIIDLLAETHPTPDLRYDEIGENYQRCSNLTAQAVIAKGPPIMQSQEAAVQKPHVDEIPQNGLAGLKHWRSDMIAGLMVSLVSLPFSLGIAIASGAPPVAGLVSAIIAGAIYPFLGGSFVTISGPAAGLAPSLFIAMTALGGVCDESHAVGAGYPKLLCVICMVGCVQIILSRLKVARFSAWFSPTVVEAMLASIGLLIIAKCIPNMMGLKFEAHEFWGVLAEIPSQVSNTQPIVLLVGVACLALTVMLSMARARWTKIIPPPLTVVGVGLLLGWLLQIPNKFMISVPADPLKGIVFPNFSALFADRSLWFTVFTTVITLTLIDGVESLATIAGIDKIDPYKRKSSPDRTLMAMGVSNILSSLAGGLTIIPGGVKSTTCIVTGGKTLWAHFYNAIFLVMYLYLASGLINLIPLTALSAIVVFIGYKLCKPKVWRHVAHIGSEQLLVFCATVLITVSTDLLLGIISGMVLEFALNVSLAWPTRKLALAVAGEPAAVRPFGDMFRNPVTNRELLDNQYHVYFEKPLVSFNLLHVNRELTRIPEQATEVYFHVGSQVTLIDHTSSSNLLNFARDYKQSGKGQVHFSGLEEMLKCSDDDTCVRLGALSVTEGAKSGISALFKKVGQALHRRPAAWTRSADSHRVPAPPHFAGNSSNDLAFLSLSAGGDGAGVHETDVTCLGPRPSADAASELGRLSLCWDAPAAVARHQSSKQLTELQERNHGHRVT